MFLGHQMVSSAGLPVSRGVRYGSGAVVVPILEVEEVEVDEAGEELRAGRFNNCV